MDGKITQRAHLANEVYYNIRTLHRLTDRVLVSCMERHDVDLAVVAHYFQVPHFQLAAVVGEIHLRTNAPCQDGM